MVMLTLWQYDPKAVLPPISFNFLIGCSGAFVAYLIHSFGTPLAWNDGDHSLLAIFEGFSCKSNHIVSVHDIEQKLD